MQKQFTHQLLLKNVKEIIQVSNNKDPFLKAQSCQEISPLHACNIIVDNNGLICKIISNENLPEWMEVNHAIFSKQVDCSALVAVPGFVDAHTHALFAGDRSKQFDMKLNGKTYVDIYNEGLGIRYTTEQINAANLEDLVQHLNKYLTKMSRLGTTTVEIKSGYGLNAHAEVKMLKAIEIARIANKHKIDIIATFCGAHAIPKGKTQAEQTQDVIHHQIPAVQEALHKKEINPKFIDVFCEKKFFQKESSIAIMKAGKEIGLIPSFHGDELNNLECGLIAGQVGARAVSHLEYLSEAGIQVMAEQNIAAILLPTTQNIQKLPIPPVKSMRSSNMIIAMGSDFCPNAFCYNMALVSHLGCVNYRLTPKQSLAAITLNSAYALGISDQVGSIEEGKQADIVLLDVESWVCLMYKFGDNLISKVIKNGVVL